MKIGIDCDGVLANFNHAFVELTVRVLGKDLYPGPAGTFDIFTWNYPEFFGYTSSDVTKIWDHIKSDPDFWLNIPAYKNTKQAMKVLANLQQSNNDIYFITNRMGVNAKRQTEKWLDRFDMMPTTVLLSKEKGFCATALALDAYIDDKWENCVDVAMQNDTIKVFCMDQPWNHTKVSDLKILRVSSILEMLSYL